MSESTGPMSPGSTNSRLSRQRASMASTVKHPAQLTKTCSDKNCDRFAVVDGLCNKHFFTVSALNTLAEKNRCRGDNANSIAEAAAEEEEQVEEEVFRLRPVKKKPPPRQRRNQNSASDDVDELSASLPPTPAPHPNAAISTHVANPRPTASSTSSSVSSSAALSTTDNLIATNPSSGIASTQSTSTPLIAKQQSNSTSNSSSSLFAFNVSDKLRNICLEFLSTEKTYVKGLKGVCLVMDRLTLLHLCSPTAAAAATVGGMPAGPTGASTASIALAGAPTKDPTILNEQQIRDVFLNVEHLCDLHQSLYAELKEARYNGGWANMVGQLGSSVQRYAAFFKLYIPFVLDHQESSALLLKLRSKHDYIDFFFDVEERLLGECMESLMITPIQRIPRYSMLLQEMIRLGEGELSSATLQSLQDALATIKKVAHDINESFGRRDMMEMLLAVDSAIKKKETWLMKVPLGEKQTLLGPSRYIVHQGIAVQKRKNFFGKSKLEDVFVIVLNDMLVWCDRPPAGVNMLHGANTKVKVDCRGIIAFAEPFSCFLTEQVKKEKDSEEGGPPFASQFQLNLTGISPDVLASAAQGVLNAEEVKKETQTLMLVFSSDADRKQWHTLVQKQQTVVSTGHRASASGAFTPITREPHSCDVVGHCNKCERLWSRMNAGEKSNSSHGSSTTPPPPPYDATPEKAS